MLTIVITRRSQDIADVIHEADEFGNDTEE